MTHVLQSRRSFETFCVNVITLLQRANARSTKKGPSICLDLPRPGYAVVSALLDSCFGYNKVMRLLLATFPKEVVPTILAFVGDGHDEQD